MYQVNKDMHKTPIIVTIAGDLGSGKSRLTTALCAALPAEKYSTGAVMRKLAVGMGLTALELGKRAETDPKIDEMIDSAFRDLAQTPVNLVVDSRMAWHFLPDSFKIKLLCSPAEAVRRVKKDVSRIGEGQYETDDEILAGLTARKESERARFKQYYNVDIEDPANYTLVIDTSIATPDMVAAHVLARMDDWMHGRAFARDWASLNVESPQLVAK